MDAEVRTRIESRLEERLAELTSTRTSMREGGDDSELSNLDQHPADQGTETHHQEVDATTEIFFEEEERRIAEARSALANGTYGTCQGCGQEIPEGRLEAMPEAVRCLDCQRHFEGSHRQITPA